MTYKEAAQAALDCQNGCNASGIAKSMMQAIDALWIYADNHGMGTKWVNRHPIMSMFLCKLGELNGLGLCSLTPGYDRAEKACRLIVSEQPEPDYRRLDWEV